MSEQSQATFVPEPELLSAERPSLERKGCFGETFTREEKRERINLLQARRGLKRHGYEELPAEEVIKRAVETCGEHLTLGWSGGKCSTIVLHIALKIEPKIKVIYNNTGVEFPENVKYVHEVAKLWHVNLHELHPKSTFWKVVKEYGFPTFQSRSFKQKRGKWNANPNKKPMCCWVLKEETRFNFYKEHQIIGDIGGLRAAESRVRAIHVGQMSQIHTLKKPAGFTNYLPIALWTAKECENYLAQNQIPYNHTYDTQTRNGCWPCTAYLNWKRNLMLYNPKMYRFIQNLQGVKLITDFEEAC